MLGVSPTDEFLCRIHVVFDSSDSYSEGLISTLSSGDVILLNNVELDHLSMSSTSDLGSSPSPSMKTICNLNAVFSSNSHKKLSFNSTLIIVSRLMSLCTSFSLFPPLTVSEVFQLTPAQRNGFLKVLGYIINTPNRKRDRPQYETDSEDIEMVSL